MKDFIIKIYSNEKFPIILGIIIAVLVVAFIVVYFIGKKDQKKNEQNSANPVPDAFGQNNNIVNVQGNGFVNPAMPPQMNNDVNMMNNQMPMGPSVMPNPGMMPNMGPMPMNQDPMMQNQFVQPSMEQMPINNMMVNPNMNAPEMNFEPVNFASPMQPQMAMPNPGMMPNMGPMPMNQNIQDNFVNPAIPVNNEPVMPNIEPKVEVAPAFEMPAAPVIEEPIQSVVEQTPVVEAPVQPVLEQPYSNSTFAPSSVFSSVNVTSENELPELNKVNAIANSIESDLNTIESKVESTPVMDDNDETMAIELPKLKTEEVKPLLSDDNQDKLNI